VISAASLFGPGFLAPVFMQQVQGYDTLVLAASLRHPMHVVEAAKAGADVATMPYDVFSKLVKHPLTDSGLDKFLSDWKKLQQEL